LVAQLQLLADNVLDQYKGLFANYLVKPPYSKHQVGLHQDWTYADESKYTSVNIWMPLCNTNHENGALFVIPKTHLINGYYRSTPFDTDLYNLDMEMVESKSQNVNTEIVEAIIYDSRMLHFSECNKNSEERVVCATIFIPNEAEGLHYFREGNTLLEFKTDLNFYCHLQPGLEPPFEPTKTIEEINKPTAALLTQFLEKL